MFKKKLMVVFLVCMMLFSVSAYVLTANAQSITTKNEKKTEELCQNNAILLSEVIDDINYLEAQTSIEQWKKDKEGNYIFPINTDSSQWKNMKSHIEMIQACNVPDGILRKSSTDELLELVLSYPILCDIFAYNDNFEGVCALARQFNAFGELLQRNDIATVVFNRYLNQNIYSINSDSEKGFSMVSETVVLETILAQKDIISDLTDNEQQVLLDELETKLTKKIGLEIYNGNLSTFYDIAEKNGTATQLGLNGGIVERKLTAVKENVIYVKTPKGSKVEVKKNSYKGAAWSEDLTKECIRAYPAAFKEGKADNRYNCHSYAWYSHSDTNPYWMNSPKTYVNDGSYKYIGVNPTAKNQIVVYKDQTIPKDMWVHSGVTLNNNGGIISKWGQGPLMKHNIGYDPYTGQYNVVHFYKKAS